MFEFSSRRCLVLFCPFSVGFHKLVKVLSGKSHRTVLPLTLVVVFELVFSFIPTVVYVTILVEACPPFSGHNWEALLPLLYDKKGKVGTLTLIVSLMKVPHRVHLIWLIFSFDFGRNFRDLLCRF